MYFNYNGNNYNIIIDRKNNKNMYFRVKEDLSLYVTCNKRVSDKEILKIIDDNRESIYRLFDKVLKKVKNSDGFLYLGKKYDIVYANVKGILFASTRVFINRNIDIDKWYKNEAKKIFKERLDHCYNNYTRNIPYPSLRIRKMTSRWGVCNYKDTVITLNSELMKYDPICLDYVIYHELSHLIEHDHQKGFWSLVEENFKDFKKAKKILREN